MKRLIAFDIARAICVILVVLGHYLPDNAPDWYAKINSVIYLVHMPLFFFASGYVFASKTNGEFSYGGFLLKKVKRLIIPYLTTSLIILCVKLVAQQFTIVDHPVSFSSFYQILYLPEAGYYLWFIMALWWMFVISPLCRTKTTRLVLLSISIILHFVPSIFHNDVFCLNNFQRMYVFFNLGVICTYFSAVIKQHLNMFVSLVAFIICVLLNNIIANNVFILFISAVIGIACVMKIAFLLESHTNNPITICSLKIYVSSYIIYLFHTTFMGLARFVLSNYPLFLDCTNNFYFTIGVLLIVSCGIIVPMLLHKFILAKSRLTRLLFGL